MTSLANVSNPSCDTSSLKANSPVVAPDFDFRATDGLSNAEIKSTRSGVCTKERLAKETRLGRRRTARIFENISKVDINVVSSRWFQRNTQSSFLQASSTFRRSGDERLALRGS